MKFRKAFSLGNFILEFVQSIVLALSVFVLLYLFVVQPNQVSGSSMEPNFKNGEYLLTDKLTYQFSSPQRGQVVVFRAPASEPCSADECEYIKRIIALPGDRIKVENQKVYLNGQLLNQSWIPTDFVTEPGSYCQEGVEVTVPLGTYLVFGDNRSHSRDGREFGPIKKDSIVGRAFFVYWPIKSMGLVPTISF
ncbi:MAG: signal peptidase I [Candidatus Shapirobacteria bacterium]|jgi:signal peptidase I